DLASAGKWDYAFVARNKRNEVVGYIFGLRGRDLQAPRFLEDAPVLAQYPDSMYVWRIGIREDYRNQNLVARLFQKLAQACREDGITNLSLQTGLDNTAARLVYGGKLGFVEAETAAVQHYGMDQVAYVIETERLLRHCERYPHLQRVDLPGGAQYVDGRVWEGIDEPTVPDISRMRLLLGQIPEAEVPSEVKLREEIRGGGAQRLLVARDEFGQVIGVVRFWRDGQEISQLAVDVEHRRQGVGRALLVRALRTLVEEVLPTVETALYVDLTDNSLPKSREGVGPSARMAESLGFQRMGSTNRYLIKLYPSDAGASAAIPGFASSLPVSGRMSELLETAL
ncbi:MAG: GNAT family N-acetyltransferase, partial [Candidatus Omnitrophica bacterium]|nr:GNAT family N-acetyltransferase [Candidatus Omnitrophota bacterium]